MTELGRTLLEISESIKQITRRVNDLELTGIISSAGTVPAAGTIYNHLEDDGAAWISVTNLTFADDAWIGLGAAAGRLIFDDLATDQLQIANADLYLNTGLGIIHADGVGAGWLLQSDGTRYVPANPAASLPIPPVAEGDTLIANAGPAWSILTTPGAAGQARVSTATTENWSAIPAWIGAGHSWTSGGVSEPLLLIENTNADANSPLLQFYKNSASPADNDDLGELNFYGETDTGAKFRFAYTLVESADVTNADAAGKWHFLVAQDAGLTEMLQLSGYNGAVNEGEIILNNGANDIDFIVKSDTLADALTVDGATGQPRLGLLGAGFVQSDVNGDLSSAGIIAGDLPLHTHAGAGQGGTITHAVTTGQTVNDHHTEAHVVNSTGPHAEAGLTVGHVLRASAAGAFSFAALQGTDLPWSGAATRVAFWSGANTLTGDAGMTYNAATDSLTVGDYFTTDGGQFGIAANELLTVNAAGNFAFSGIGSVVVPDGAWVGADANASWVFDTSNNDVTTQDTLGVGTAAPNANMEIRSTTSTFLNVISDSGGGGTAVRIGSDYDSGGGSRDPYLTLGTNFGGAGFTPAVSWSIGIDDNDSDKLKIDYVTAAWATPGSGTMVTITTGGDIGAGITAPEAKLHLFETGTLSQIIETESDTQAPNLTFIRSNAGPAAVTAGKVIGGVRGFGFDGVGDIMGGRIRFEVDGTPGVNDMPTRFIIELTADGAAAVTERVRVDQAGRMGIGTAGAVATSAILELSSTTGAFLASRMTTAQRNALTAVNGMIIYNSSTNAFNFREASAWVTGSGLA